MIRNIHKNIKIEVLKKNSKKTKTKYYDKAFHQTIFQTDA